MIKFLFALAAMFLAGCQTLQPPTDFAVEGKTVQIIGFMDENLMATPLAELYAAPEDEVVQIYIHSLGGDPRVAEKFVDALKDRKSICYATAAGGGAFTILQSCTYRIIGEGSLVGSMTIGVSGTSGDPEEDKAFIAKANALNDKFKSIDADRLGLSVEDYEKVYNSGFAWTKDAIMKNKAADSVLALTCAPGTQERTMSRTIRADEQEVELVFTTCPVPRTLVEPKGVPGPQVGEILGFPIHRTFTPPEAEVEPI